MVSRLRNSLLFLVPWNRSIRLLELTSLAHFCRFAMVACRSTCHLASMQSCTFVWIFFKE
jgi:hypothetical protein